MDPETVIYRDEVLTMMGVIGDIRSELERLRRVFDDDDDEEEEEADS